MSMPTSSSKRSRPSKALIELRPDHRLFLVGKTGSGKTTLAKLLLQLKSKKKPIAIVGDYKWCDPDKGESFADSGPGTVLSPRKVKRFNPRLHVQFYEPSLPGWNDDGLQRFYSDVKRHGNIVCYTDELYKVCDSHHVPQPFLLLWSEGRKFKVEAWGGAQRPALLPDIVMSQAEEWMVFRITNQDDLKKIKAMTGSAEILEKRIPPRYWWYWNEASDDAVLMRPIEVKTHAKA